MSQMLGKPAGGAGVWTLRPDGSVAVTRPDTSEVFRAQRLEWTVIIDKQLTEEIVAIRARSLPAETGGVLLGVVDAAAQSIHIVDALAAPPDSVEQSVGFERGI